VPPRASAGTAVRDVPTGLRSHRAVAAVFMILLAGLFAAVRPSGALAIRYGTPVAAGNFSYTADIEWNGSHYCTGSLIDPRFVLTADHCAHQPGAPGSYKVYVGNNIRDTGGQVRTVKRIFVDPWYVGGHNDLALLELSSPITTITPVKLATPAQRTLWDGVNGGTVGTFSYPDLGTAVGWGAIDPAGNYSSQLQSADLLTLGQDNDGLHIPEITAGASLCPGDSGGPLLIYAGGEYVQAGVAKAGDCSSAANWSIVGEGQNRDWILSVLAPEDPLLAAVPKGTCANDTLYVLDYNYSDQQRYAVQCLINQVRLKAGLNKLSFCALSGTYCENNIPGANLNFAQMKGFNIAAQYRAQDVKNCGSGTVFYGNPVQYGACGRPPEWWPRSDAYLCIGLTSSQCQPWYAPGWLPNVYEAQAYGVDGATPREAVDQILKSIARGAILKPGLNFSGVGVSIGASNGLFMPSGKTGNVYDVFTS